jgi:hypothetical protein
MEASKWALACAAVAFLATSPYAMAQGKGHGKGHNKHSEDEAYYYGDRDQEELRGWYNVHESNLPPGLAKKDHLPPGLEKQLVRRGTLPPGLQKKIQPVPVDLERRLPPPPPDCANVLVGGHIVLLNRRTNIVVDIFHFEIN